ncbi:MAG: hypothetical protein ACFE8U_12955 [Candidatus Hermodarchaeota archaeon]
MPMSGNPDIRINNKPKEKLPRRLSKKSQFYKGFKQYYKKNWTFGRKTFIRRVQYRQMLWEKAPPLFLGFIIVFSFAIIVMELINLSIDSNPLLIMLFLILFCLGSILEIWYVGRRKKNFRIGRKIRRKKLERDQKIS